MSFQRLMRLSEGRLVVSFPYADQVMLSAIKHVEGRLWNSHWKVWTVPASLRVIEKLSSLGVLSPKGDPLHQHIIKAKTSWRDCPPISDPNLFPFQARGVSWLRQRSRALLHDEQGLGKTRQVLAVSQATPGLVICPKVLIPQWRQEITRQYGAGVLSPEGWQVLNYERAKQYGAGKLYHLIVDECHFAKTPSAQRTKEVLKLSNRCERLTLLSGTPITKRPKDLWMVYVLCQERDPGQFFKWAERYCAAEQTPYGWDFNGASHLDELALDMRHFCLRRTKEEVLPDLPPKLYTTLVMENQKKVEGRKLHAFDAEIFSLLSRGVDLRTGAGFDTVQALRQEVSVAKISMTGQWIEGFDALNSKVVVFTAFRNTARLLEIQCESLAVPHWRMTGDTPDEERESALNSFRESDCGVFICTYGTGGMGLNLQHASTMVIHDLPWTPMELTQATDRIHRIGQENPVHIVTMLSGVRSEEIMLEGLRRSQDIITALQGDRI